MKVKLHTKNGGVIRAHVARTDTVIGHTVLDVGGVEQSQFYFVRTEFDEYRQLSVKDAKAVLQWVDLNSIDVDEMTMADCEGAIERARNDEGSVTDEG